MTRSVAFRSLVLGAFALAVLACAEHEFEPPDRAQRVAQADSLFSQTLFDTVTWGSDAERALVGNEVYAAECTDCHGPLGRGNTAYARERALEPPSLVAPDWEYAGDLEGVRHRIFVGHPEGMPTWGFGRITVREVDAVAFYLLRQLRPDARDADTLSR